MLLVKQNDTAKKILMYLPDSTNTAAGKTGLTPTVRISKNGAAFGAGGGTVAELESGFYAYTVVAGDVDTLGPLGIRASATGAVDYVGVRQVVPFDPYDAARLGLSSLPPTALHIAGTVNDGAPTASTFATTIANGTVADEYKFGVMVFTSGALAGLPGRAISAWGTNTKPTFNSPWPAAPANGDSFIILGCVK
jgi:hypothetical protein